MDFNATVELGQVTVHNSHSDLSISHRTLINLFESRYGKLPDFLVSSSESGLELVMAVAVEQSAFLPAHVILVHVDDTHPFKRFGKMSQVDESTTDWSNYFKFGYKATLSKLNLPSVGSMKIAVEGPIPIVIIPFFKFH
ncbi:hypothetical protein BC833DRAFT_247667 [Globomyces pollinis-pini]|nr:hypothetical protein BC833DRAFT_247667 [Globomyces pollinis-pini]